MGFSRQEYWSGLPGLPSGNLANQQSNPDLLHCRWILYHLIHLHRSYINRWQYTALTYSFPNSEPVCCSMSGSNCCFLTCIQVSQEAGKVVRYSHLFKDFPLVIHTVKGVSVVNEAEVDVFLEFSCFFCDQTDVGNLVPLPFLNPAWTSGSSWFTYYWSLTWRILSICLLACETSWLKHILYET